MDNVYHYRPLNISKLAYIAGTSLENTMIMIAVIAVAYAGHIIIV